VKTIELGALLKWAHEREMDGIELNCGTILELEVVHGFLYYAV
jgi:hypothetical protein